MNKTHSLRIVDGIAPAAAAPTLRPPLRVLHVLHSISPACGGPVESLWFLLRAARGVGIETAVVTTDHDGPRRRADVPFGRFVEVNGFQVRYFPCQSQFYTASLPMLFWLRRHVRDFDVVHVHALFSFAPVVAAYCARGAGVPYVISPHGVLNMWGRENRRRRLKSASIRHVEGPLLRDAAKLQFTSRRELEEFSQLGIRVAAEVIPLALTGTAEMASLPAYQAPPELLALTGPVILFLARIHPIKNLDMLLRAFAGVLARYPAAALVVAGDGEPDVVSGLRSLARNLGIDNNVRWVGFARADIKRWLLGRADVFVLPSWSENFGLAVAEAMSAGIPVIVTRGVGIADIVLAAGCGVVTDCSEPALCAAIESLLDDEPARLRMGLAGRRAAREELSLDTYAARLESLYRSAAAPTATPAGGLER